MSPAPLPRLRRAAARWRKTELASMPHIVGGYVVAWPDQPDSWISHLRDPQRWQPGCIAVPADEGPCYRATGGDYQSGATAWTPIVVTSIATDVVQI